MRDKRGPRAGQLRVTLKARPFDLSIEERWRRVEGTLADIVYEYVKPQHLKFAHALVQGEEVPQVFWGMVRPKAGVHVHIAVVPANGGGGKGVLGSVLTVALAFAAPYAGAALATGTGLATATSAGLISWNVLGVSGVSIATGLASVAGRLALSGLVGATSQKKSSGAADPADSPTQFIAGARNQLLPRGRIPYPLGKVRMVPPYAAKPYTESIGNDQYVRMLFVWGFGPMTVGDLRIGDTDITQFQGVEIEHRYGYPDDTPLTLYSNSVSQQDLAVVLSNAAGWQLRTTAAEVDEISLDITFLKGMVGFNDDGGHLARNVKFEIQYRLNGTTDWTDAEGYKAVAAATTAWARRPAPAAAGRTAGRKTTVVTRICLHKVSGALQVLQGPVWINGVTAGAPQAPAVPADYVPLARVSLKSDQTTVVTGDIVDERDPALVGPVFGDSTDFAVTPGAASGGRFNFTVAAGRLKSAVADITGRQTNALIYSQRWPVPRGRYDVRIRRTTADSTSDRIVDEATWTALRSIKSVYPVNFPGLALTAIRIKATDQLNGTIDQISGVVQSILPDWDGSQWVTRATSNPAAMYRCVLQGPGNKSALADGRVDLDGLQAWAEYCTAKGFEFNLVVDYDVSVFDILGDIAATGRASRNLRDGLWGVVQDVPQTVPAQLFTQRNVRGFESAKAFADLPQGFTIQFKNRDNDWQDDERIVPAPGYTEDTADKLETVRANGVTSADQAWKYGRYLLGAAILRPQTYTFSCDIEHLACTRGDLVHVAHDVIVTGIGQARIKALIVEDDAVTGFVLDSIFELQGTESYVVRIRYADNRQAVFALQSFTGETDTFNLIEPMAPDDVPEVGDLVAMGLSGAETRAVIITAIEYLADMSARITCVDAAPEIHDLDTGEIPAHTPALTVPVDLQRPPRPVIASIQSDDSALISNSDGTVSTAIKITLAPSGFPRDLTPVARIRGIGETFFRTASAMVQDKLITITDVEAGEYYDLSLVYRSPTGIFSAEYLLSSYLVLGDVNPPDDVTGFRVNIVEGSAFLSWNRVPAADLSHYRLRFSPLTDTGAVWESSVDYVEQISAGMTSVSVPARVGTYLIKAVDYSGRESLNAALLISRAGLLDNYNAVEALTESPTFPGEMDGVMVSDIGLRLGYSSLLDDADDVDALANFDSLDGPIIASGTYDFSEVIDLGEVFTSRVTASFVAIGLDTTETVDAAANFDLIEDFDGSAPPSQWSVKIQISLSDDDPADPDAVWTDWRDLVIGDYPARAYRFRALLAGLAEGVTPVISALSVTVDMPDRVESGKDLVSAATDDPTVVVFPKAFHVTPAIAVTPQELQTGDSHKIENQSRTGFHITFRDSVGARVTRTFDFVAKGYGAEQTGA